ncbi:MAG: hypothetical protein N2588_10725 [Rhodovarius sp.]|nr:hypothetical protein [Rhodovarius sp.]
MAKPPSIGEQRLRLVQPAGDAAGFAAQLADIARQAEAGAPLLAAWSQVPELLRESGLSAEALRALLRDHPIRRLARQDPLAPLCAARPVDSAAILDLLLRRGQGHPDRWESNPTGRQIFAVTSRLAFASGLKERRQFAAELIDQCADRRPEPVVVSLASGRLPEAALSRAAAEGRIGRWLLVDEKEATLRAALADHPTLAALEPRLIPPIRFLNQLCRQPEVEADLLLFGAALDGLDELTMGRLLQCGFRSLAPGGSLLLGAFAFDLPDALYLDVMLDWRPVRRSESELRAAIRRLPPEEIGDFRVFRGPSRAMVYLHITRRG